MGRGAEAESKEDIKGAETQGEVEEREKAASLAVERRRKTLTL